MLFQTSGGTEGLRPISCVLSRLIARLAAQLFQLVEARSALSDVGEKARLWNVTGSLGEFH